MSPCDILLHNFLIIITQTISPFPGLHLIVSIQRLDSSHVSFVRKVAVAGAVCEPSIVLALTHLSFKSVSTGIPVTG